MIEGQPLGKKEAIEAQEHDPQPSLGSYYNLLEGRRIIPQKIATNWNELVEWNAELKRNANEMQTESKEMTNLFLLKWKL